MNELGPEGRKSVAPAARPAPNDAALVLIDHQSGIMQLVHDYSPAEFRNNVMALAKLGKVFNLPTILTTSLGQGPNVFAANLLVFNRKTAT